MAASSGRRAVVLWLAFMSLVFYGYWRPIYLLVLLVSILFNFLMASLISRKIPNSVAGTYWLIFAILVNLSALCYYKYLIPILTFFSLHITGNSKWEGVLLPLGISFFTFTQIAYLVDLQEGQFERHDLADYTLFATFFPHLIAGPILHHAEILPQFQANRDYRLRLDDLAVGASWFIMGLLKKVILADHFAPGANAAFSHPYSLSASAAWAGSLGYALQLYFDFSGYSDMAMGLARMFSIHFPLNFSSPYKATNVIDFWQRWHITLTRYINLYVYNPIAVRIARWRVERGLRSSRKAMATPTGFISLIAFPTFFTLFIAGVWHGAGLQFIAFGLLHASYLVINHAWRVWASPKLVTATGTKARASSLITMTSRPLTFAAVLLAQVFFRASSVRDACHYTAGLAGTHTSIEVMSDPERYHPAASFFGLIAVGLVIVWCFPNTQQILAKFKPATEMTGSDKNLALIHFWWRPSNAWAIVLSLLLFWVVVKMQDPSTFLYFQF